MTICKRAFLLLAAVLVPAGGRVWAGDEPPVQGEGRTLSYLRSLHAKVHRAWADSFLTMAAAKLPKEHPVNLATRAVVLEVVLAPGGRLLNVEASTPSGAAEFDSSAVDVVRANVPYEPPPADELSDDGNLHLLWTFARDDRRCSGLQVKYAQRPLPEAVRSLVAQGREDVAIRRLQAADDEARAHAFSSFAWAWLDRANADQGLAVAAARTAGGDRAGADKLRQAVAQGHDVEAAAAALVRLAIPLCPLVKEKLAGPAREGRGVAVAALRLGLDRECLPGVLAVAKDRSAPEAQRVAAIEALGTLDDPEAQKVLHGLIKDPAPAIRGAGLLAGTRFGAGRGAVFRATGLLNDPAPEVRGAAAAALLRAGGEAMVAQVFRTLKEKDPRPGELVAKQLGAMKGEASVEMLGKLVRAKFDRRVRLVSAWALAQRKDEAAVKLLATLAGDQDPELRFLACAGADSQKRLAAASAPEAQAWRKSYAVLAAGRGRMAALDWALAQFPKLDQAARVEITSPWLAVAKPDGK
jgi:TonB family protein